jgi:uncharacterized protein
MRTGTRRWPALVGLFVVLASLPFAAPVAAAGSISLGTTGSPYAQDFDTLGNVQGSSTNSALPVGWDLTETGGGTRDNELYGADNGFSATGDTYSYGTSSSTDRAFGGLRSGTLIPVIGASFTNNTGVTVGALQISYRGEMWRSGVLSRGAADRMDFQLSTDATSLATGAWTDYDTLDYSSTVISSPVNPHDGNDPAFRTTVSSTINGLSIANGATFWIRWNDFDISSSDDGLAVDDFSLTPLDIDAAPQVNVTSPLNGATGVLVSSNVDLTFSEPVNVTGTWFDITCSSSGNHTAGVSGGATTWTLNPDTDFAQLETCTVTVFATQVADQDSSDPPDNMSGNYTFSFQTEGNVCTLPFTPIYSIQGSGALAAITGNVTTQGVVVGDFEGPIASGVQGFYMQDATGDGDATTSDGIFVFTGNTDNGVAVGDVVRVTGFARERFPNAVTGAGQTTISGANNDSSAVPPASIVDCGSTASITPVDVTLPFPTLTFPERYEGMSVRLPQALVISEYFNYDRFGEIVLAQPLPGESRVWTPTAIEEPGSPAYAARLDTNLRSRITLDDNVGAQNPPVNRHPNGLPFSLTNYFRGGDTVANTVGVMGFDFSLYRIMPTAPADYTAVNPRPSAPEDTDGRLTVAAQNTLNFFLTLDTTASDTGPGPCGGNANLDCRGADSDQPLEFDRQRNKLLATLAGLDADVIGLNEIENTPGVSPLGDPSRGIVAGLNAMPGVGPYAFIDTGVIGTDAIRVGLIYRPGVVTPVGNFEILSSADDPRFIDTRNRPVLAQTFEENATGSRFTVAVNHLKSKGSACADIGDPDTGDGSGNCNGTRTLAAQALVDWLATDPTGSGDPDFLIIGDLNSYAQESPIDAIKAGPDDVAGNSDDYTNLVHQFRGTYAYSYVFDGMSGYLDHALSTASLTSQVTGVAEWHINADEADLLDYDTSFKPPAQDALYEPAAYRSSDHDGVIVGLDLDAAPVITSLTGPAPFKVGTSQSFNATWTDVNEDDTHSTTWEWGDGSPDTIHSPATSPDAASHTYTAAGFYTVTFTVTDSTGLSDSETLMMIVYDPAAGWVTGSGTYTGGGTFSLSAKYNPSGTSITGTTSFAVPGTSFVSTSTSWMVVSGNAATYAGAGTVNGVSGYSFLVSVTDGGSPASKDRVRFQVTDSGGAVVYDTQPGAPINAAPTTTPTSGNVVVH